MAYGVTYLAMKKDIVTQLTNQGTMGNRTDYSESIRNSTVLKEFKESEKAMFNLIAYVAKLL